MGDITREGLDDLIENLKEANLITEVYERTAMVLEQDRYNEWVQRRAAIHVVPGSSADN